MPSIIEFLISIDEFNRDNWAKTASPNPDVKVFIGAPAAPLAAGSGYVDPATLTTIIQSTKAEFSSFGGVMLVSCHFFYQFRAEHVYYHLLVGYQPSRWYVVPLKP